MSRHRDQGLRPRYGRLAALLSSLAVTMIAVLGGTGVLPSAADVPTRHQAAAAIAPEVGELADSSTVPDPAASAASAPAASAPAASAASADPARGGSSGPATAGAATDPAQQRVGPQLDAALPPASGTGRRVVFSESRQRVWLVSGGSHVVRTYLVSGSVTDNLHPGTYAVYSRSEQAYGIDDSGTMKYFVRFTQGEHAAIGFHDIPVKDGHLLQTPAQLGTPQSHGCIRQLRRDAIALWRFAPLGTTVVVTV